MMETINSIKDSRIVLAREIKSRKGRQERKRILLEGEQILDWAIEHALPIEYVLVGEKAASATAGKYLARGYQVYAVSDGIIKKVTDTSYVIPVVAVASAPANKRLLNSQFVVVLDRIQDLGNIGTLVRTCQAFGIRSIISTTTDIDLYQRKTIEASRGSVFDAHLDFFESGAETVQYLRKEGYQIVATSPRGAELQSLVELKRQPVALVVGNETTGISPEIEEQADFLVQIPMDRAVESLNVGVAAGISIYEIKLKQVLAMIEERIKSTLGRELNVAGLLVQQALDAELNKVSNLSSQQVIFMMVLKCDRRMSREDMCKQFGLLESEAEGLLRPLRESGLVVQGEKSELTEKGEQVLGKLWAVVERTEEMALSGLAADEASRLLKNLQRIQDNCIQIVHGK